ncbi:aspartyl-phosphate phosphatase Spo0E family protein [Paenibacillus brevis]|nr:aspartyl-phosphate phosphatase Spo0E family protein [Paenibacillus brevis]
MGCGEIKLPFEMDDSTAGNGNHLNEWEDEASRMTSPHAVSPYTLEDEIRILRYKMVKLFQQENSFTSDNVIEISSLLDLKINEFMRTYQKNE